MKPGLRCARRAGLGFLLLLLALGRLPAQDTLPPARDLQFDMFPGYGGLMGQFGWAPVMFDLKNDGQPFNGRIQLSAQAFSSGEDQAMVELPSGTLKRVTVPVFANQRWNVHWNARLFDDKGRPRADALNQQGTATTVANWKTRILAALPRATGGTPVLPGIKSRNTEFQPVVARLQAPLFPDNPIVLDRLNAIYLNSQKASELKPSQVAALLAWLHAGGHLIIGVEEPSEVNSVNWLKNIFPGRVEGTRNVQNHIALFEWLKQSMPSPDDKLFPPASSDAPFSSIEPDAGFETAPLLVARVEPDGARSLVEGPDGPLIVQRTLDRGRVTALLFSPEREPARAWKHLPILWARLLEVPPVLYENPSLQNTYDLSSDGIFGAMVDSRQIQKLPVTWLLLLLVVYLVVIGPLDRWWLKKINKPVLTWITFPCYVVLFSGLIYLIGYKLRAGDSEWNELHLVDVFPAGQKCQLRGRAYASLYSPANATYPLASSARIAVIRAEAVVRGSDRGNLAVLQQGDTFRANFEVPVWQNQLCVSDYWLESGPAVEVTARRQINGVSLTVQNHLDRPLTHVRAVHEGRIATITDLPAGGSKTVLINGTTGTNLTEWAWSVGQVFQSAVQQRGQSFGDRFGGRIENAPDASTAASFLRMFEDRTGANVNFMAPPGLDLSPLLRRGQAVILGWSEGYAPIAPINQFTPRRSWRNTLWRLTCEVED